MKARIFILLVLASFYETANAATEFLLIGGQDSPLLLDSEYSVSDTTGTFYISATESGFRLSYRDHSGSTDLDSEVMLSAPATGKLLPGVYLNAGGLSESKASEARISVGLDHITCIAKNSDIYVFEYDVSGEEPVVAIDFAFRCYSSYSGTLRGAIRVNSDVASPYNQLFAAPYTYGVERAVEGEEVQLNGEKSLIGLGNRTASYEWDSISGPAPMFDDRTSSSPKMILPSNVALGGEDTVIALTVTNDLGESSTETKAIRVESKSDPRTYFTLKEISLVDGDKIENSSFDTNSMLFDLHRNDKNGVSANLFLDSFGYWPSYYVWFSAPNDVELNEGMYDGAETPSPYEIQNAPAFLLMKDEGWNSPEHDTSRHHMCTESNMSFNLSSIQWAGNNQHPAEFFATYLLECVVEQKQISGTLSFNARNPSVPTADAGADLMVYENDVVHLDGSGSFDNLGELAEFQWSAVDSDVQLTDADKVNPYFSAPELNGSSGNRLLTVKLLVIDDEGYKAQSSVSITVSKKPQTTNSSNDNPGSSGGSFGFLILILWGLGLRNRLRAKPIISV